MKKIFNRKDISISNKYREEDSAAFFENTGFGDNTIFKEMLIKRGYSCCKECGAVSNLHVDHIIPISRGGTDEIDNLQLLCHECHMEKHKYSFSLYGGDKTRHIPLKYQIIRDSIEENKKIKIKYKTYSKEITERIISPIKIEIFNGRYYLWAFCYLRNEERKFRISRIKKIAYFEEKNRRNIRRNYENIRNSWIFKKRFI